MLSRSAAAVARSFVLLHVLLKADFERIMAAWPEYETRMAEACEQRLMSAVVAVKDTPDDEDGNDAEGAEEEEQDARDDNEDDGKTAGGLRRSAKTALRTRFLYWFSLF